jgi:hypothetical protein
MAIDQDFIDQYTTLLIIQYWSQPKAKATVEAYAGEFSRIFDFFDAFPDEFDVDLATGDRLDLIGKIIGFPRIVPNSLEKKFFGFDGDASARSFADLFDSTVESAPFRDLFSPIYTDTQLNDNDYRIFIKSKIAKNSTSAFLTSDDRISIQDVIQTIFDGQAYVTDNQDMTLTLHLPFGFDTNILTLIQETDLLPSGHGVGYKFILFGSFDSFGFADDPNAKGFGDLTDSSLGGSFAELIL